MDPNKHKEADDPKDSTKFSEKVSKLLKTSKPQTIEAAQESLLLAYSSVDGQLSSAKKEIDSLNQKLGNALLNSQQEKEEAGSQKGKAERDCLLYTQKLKFAECEKESLKKQIDSMREMHENVYKDMERTQSELINKYKKILSEKEHNHAQEIEKMKKHENSMTEEHERNIGRTKETEKLYKKQIDELSQRVMELEKEKEDLCNKGKQNELAQQSKSQIIEPLQNTVDISSIIQEYEDKIKDIKNLYDDDRKHAEKSLQEEKAKMAKKYENEIDDYEKRIMDMQTNHAAELENTSKELQEQQDLSKHMENECLRIEKAYTEKIKILEESLKTSQKNLDNAQSIQKMSIEQCNQQVQREKASLQEKVDGLHAKLKEKDNEIKSLKESLSLLNNRVESEDLSNKEFQNKLDKANETISALQSQNAVLNEKISSDYSYNEIKRLKEECELKAKKIAELEGTIEQTKIQGEACLNDQKEQSKSHETKLIKKIEKAKARKVLWNSIQQKLMEVRCNNCLQMFGFEPFKLHINTECKFDPSTFKQDEFYHNQPSVSQRAIKESSIDECSKVQTQLDFKSVYVNVRNVVTLKSGDKAEKENTMNNDITEEDTIEEYTIDVYENAEKKYQIVRTHRQVIGLTVLLQDYCNKKSLEMPKSFEKIKKSIALTSGNLNLKKVTLQHFINELFGIQAIRQCKELMAFMGFYTHYCT